MAEEEVDDIISFRNNRCCFFLMSFVELGIKCLTDRLIDLERNDSKKCLLQLRDSAGLDGISFI